jgi:hypothetical protein
MSHFYLYKTILSLLSKFLFPLKISLSNSLFPNDRKHTPWLLGAKLSSQAKWSSGFFLSKFSVQEVYNFMVFYLGFLPQVGKSLDHQSTEIILTILTFLC